MSGATYGGVLGGGASQPGPCSAHHTGMPYAFIHWDPSIPPGHTHEAIVVLEETHAVSIPLYPGSPVSTRILRLLDVALGAAP